MERLNIILGRGRMGAKSPYLRIVDADPAALDKDEPTEETQIARPKPIARSLQAASTCLTCNGAGYLRQDVPFGDPQFGKLVECKCHKAERKVHEQQHLRDLSQLDSLQRFQQATFDSYDFTRKGVMQAYRAALKFAARPKGWLVLAGTNGCGKTHLAVAIAKERLAENETVLFQTSPDLLDYLRAAYAPNAADVYDQAFARLREVDLLVLDDLGAEQSTSWATEKLFQLLSYRYNAMLPTVITSNRLQLQGIDQRIVSRLRDRELVTFIALSDAEDYRPSSKIVASDD